MIDEIVVQQVPEQGAVKRAVVVVDRGWIFAGDLKEEGGRIFLSRVIWLFRWEGVGIAKVLEDPKASGADLRHILDVDIPADAEIFRWPVAPEWGLSCAK